MGRGILSLNGHPVPMLLEVLLRSDSPSEV